MLHGWFISERSIYGIRSSDVKSPPNSNIIITKGSLPDRVYDPEDFLFFKFMTAG